MTNATFGGHGKSRNGHGEVMDNSFAKSAPTLSGIGGF